MAVVMHPKGSSTKLTGDFAASEFSCKGKGCCSVVKIDTKLAEYCQKIRDHFGKVVRINSGYRCPTHNRKVGGATNSYHAKGQAADIVVIGVAPAEVAKYAESIGIKGIGLYETARDGHFVHIDTRTIKSFWYGQKQEKRTTFGGSSTVTTTSTNASKEFVKDIQKALGVTVDGVAGPKTLAATITISAKKNNKHAVVKVIQKRLKDLSYGEIGSADGEAGPKFTSAVAHFQQANGCTVDGEITAGGKTWKKLLGMA